MADTSNQAHSPRSSLVRHAAQIMTSQDPHEMSPERKAASKVPHQHATQVLPDILTHAQQELLSSSSSSPHEHDSSVNAETNFCNFEKHLIANHIGSLGDTMIYNKETHHPVPVEHDAVHSQTTPQSGPKPKLGKGKKTANGSFDMAEVFYSDH